MNEVGRRVRRHATIKMVVSRAKGKTSGRYPGVVTGSMRGSVVARTSRKGRSVGIMYDETEETDEKGFYPAFLIYGVKGRIKQFSNPITDAVGERRQEIIDLITSIIDECYLLSKNET